MMFWSGGGRGLKLGIDWRRRARQFVDPYLIWADLSDFSGVTDARQGAEDGPLTLRVALELDADRPPAGVREIVRAGNLLYATASVDAAGLLALLDAEGLKRLELGFTGVVQRVSRDVDKPLPVEQSVMAVIDFGCAFAHERFRHWNGKEWKSRIAYLWDQGGRPDTGDAPRWREVSGQGYGRELTRAAIESLVNAGLPSTVKAVPPRPVDEDALYRTAGFDSADTVLTHGTHVLDLAAGAESHVPLAKAPQIIFVQLPSYAVEDTSGGSMVTHVLDALRYIVDRTGPSKSLVINLSYGSMAGPHDGSTILESAMDALIAAAQGAGGDDAAARKLAIVLPAGNNFESDGHARLHLSPQAREQELLWQLQADDPTDSFLEIWYPRAAGGQLVVRVTPPGEQETEVPIEQIALLRQNTTALPTAAVIHRARVASGQNDAMVLIALAPTRPRDARRPAAPDGIWRIVVALAADAPADAAVDVDAWIERDDPAIGSGAPPRQSRFLTGAPPLPANEHSPAGALVRRDGTCNSIANGSRTVVVGACLKAEDRFEPSRYSSSGPTRNRLRESWPDLVAPADESAALPGVPAAGTRSGTTVRMNGTSVAAPQVARQLLTRSVLAAGLQPRSVDEHDPLRRRAGRGRL